MRKKFGKRIIKNPYIRKVGRRVRADTGSSHKSISKSISNSWKELERDNILWAGPLPAMFFGKNCNLVYLVDSPESKQHLHEIITGKREGEAMPLFLHSISVSMAWRSGGTIGIFWKNRFAKKHVVAALQYLVRGKKIVLTHMTVRKPFRRNKINKLMIDMLQMRYPKKKVLFHQPTEEGRKFMDFYGGEEYNEEE